MKKSIVPPSLTVLRIMFLSVILMLMLLTGTASARYVGGDISLLPAYEDAGAKYLDHDGKPIGDIFPFLRSEGMNAMRVRVFVNPEDYEEEDKDPNACQTIESVIPLCRRIKDAGFALMIDFHYSDTWADPGQQYTPKQWAHLDDKALDEMIYSYTRESLVRLKDAGIVPDFIQPGNEISYGMLWGPVGTPEGELKKTFLGSDANWARLGSLLRNAISACKEVCPHARIVLHTERTADVPVQDNFYTKMNEMGVDYDIIGLSYYPYFHGKLSSLRNALDSLVSNFPDKEIMVVETGYAYKWEVPGTSCPVDYPYTEEGQDRFARELVSLLEEYNAVTGLFWWWMEYNAYGTSLSGWYNAPLFDSTTGKALAALKTICSFAGASGAIKELDSDLTPEKIEGEFYDLTGARVLTPSRGLFIYRWKSGRSEKMVKR